MIRSVDFLGKLVFEWKLVNFWKTIGSRAKLLIARHPVHHALVARPYVEETLEVTVSCKSTDCISAWRKKLVQKASSKMHLVTIIGTWKALCSSQFRFFFSFQLFGKRKGDKKEITRSNLWSYLVNNKLTILKL